MRLLAYLAVTPELVTRPEAAAALWPDCTDVRAAANLRSALCRLPGRSQGRAVRSTAGGISLMPGMSIDVDEIASRLARDSGIGDEVSISTLRQDLLPGWPEHWLIPAREWFRQVRLRTLRQYHVYRQLAASELGLPASPHFRKPISPLLGRPADQTA